MYDKFLISISYNKLNFKFFSFLFNEKAGAIYTFTGIVRRVNNQKNVIAINYSIFEDFFFSILSKECKVVLKDEYIKICVAQRYGKVYVGDINLLVGISAPHRNQAFLLCKYMVEFIKKQAPVWKKEFYCDGSYKWINS